MNLLANYSVVIQGRMSQKMQDPGCFTIPCAIGNHEFGRALCDSRASFNLIPLSVVRRLSLGELTPTNLILKMAKRSVVRPEGFIEDVLVKVGKFIFPIDFVVINMEEDKVLLGRPFLANSVTLIDVKKGELTFRVGKEEVKFPSSVARILSLGELTPTNLTLQMAKRYVVKPKGIIEDVLVKVGKFIFPVDFVVINMEEDKHVPILLGRPFLATGVALIDVKKGEITLRVRKEEVKFNFNQSLRQHDNEKVHCMRIEEIFAEKNEESEAEAMTEDEEENEQHGTEEGLLKFLLEVDENEETQNKEDLEANVEKKSSDGLVLKELPEHLKYVFLGKERS